MQKTEPGFVIITDKDRFEYRVCACGAPLRMAMVREIKKLEAQGHEIQRVTTARSENRKT